MIMIVQRRPSNDPCSVSFPGGNTDAYMPVLPIDGAQGHIRGAPQSAEDQPLLGLGQGVGRDASSSGRWPCNQGKTSRRATFPRLGYQEYWEDCVSRVIDSAHQTKGHLLTGRS